MKVMKFGGTSLANWQRFSMAADIVAKAATMEPVATVLSAPATVTNALLEMVSLAVKGEDYSPVIQHVERVFTSLYKDAVSSGLSSAQSELLFAGLGAQLARWQDRLRGITLLQECPDGICAEIVVAGERLSAALMEQVMLAKGIASAQLDPRKLFLGRGRPLESVVDIAVSKPRFKNLALDEKRVWVMPGFTAADEDGKVVTLGRNGSDYSAAVLAACLDASSCEIWTDVDGVYNTDPRVVADAKLLSQLSYQEAM
ncbi:MAG: bifunctional aspartate kinase/homoserine dehydrogenase I, partial [Shewanella sp.]